VGLLLARDLGARGEVAHGLESLAAIVAGQGDAGRAARLFGAAARLRETLGAVLWVGDQDEHDRAVLAVREALGDQAFIAAWA
jgi:hypothetical protein